MSRWSRQLLALAPPPIRWLRPLALFALSAVLAGCAVSQPPLSPLAPATLGRSVMARQQVTAHFNGGSRTLQTALRVAPDDLSLIGLTAIGQRLFTLSWKHGHTEMHSSIRSIADIDPKRILADMQLAYWPLQVLRDALPDGFRLAQYGTARVLWHDDKLIWFAGSSGDDPWHSTVTLYNARLGYRLTIRPLSFSSASSTH